MAESSQRALAKGRDVGEGKAGAGGTGERDEVSKCRQAASPWGQCACPLWALDAGHTCDSAQQVADSLFSKTQSPGTEGISLSSLHPFAQLLRPKATLWIFTRSVPARLSPRSSRRAPQPAVCPNGVLQREPTKSAESLLKVATGTDGRVLMRLTVVAGFKSQPSHDLDD